MGIVSRGLVATPTPIYLPPHTAIPPIISKWYPPILQQLFFQVLSCVSNLINIQSEFSYDPLWEFWLLLNLFVSYTVSEILIM